MAGVWLYKLAITKIETLMITVCWTEFHIKNTRYCFINVMDGLKMSYEHGGLFFCTINSQASFIKGTMHIKLY